MDKTDQLVTSGVAIHDAHSAPASSYLNGLARGGQRSQRSALRALAVMLGARTPFEVEWAAVTAAEVRQIRARLRTLYQGATVNRMVSALRGVLRFAHGGAVPALLLEELKGNEDVGPAPGRSLGAAELGKLLQAARPTKAGARDAAIIAVMYGSGMRRDSIVKLDVADYDTERYVFLARKAKGGKTYSVPLLPALEPFLMKWLELRSADPGPLFPRVRRGDLVTRQRLTPAGITEIIENLRKAAGVDPFTPHDLRRTFGTELLDSGADPVAVARLMGHADVKTTMRYDRRSTERLSQLLERLPVPEKP